VLFFIIFSKYYHGEQIYVNKLDRSSRIYYKKINTYKIVAQNLKKLNLAEMVISKFVFKIAVYRNMERSMLNRLLKNQSIEISSDSSVFRYGKWLTSVNLELNKNNFCIISK
jgi:hypothetical protein